MNRTKLYILILGANGLLASYLYLTQTDLESASNEPLALVTEKSIRLVDEATADQASDEAENSAELARSESSETVETETDAADPVAVCRVWGPAEASIEFDELVVALEAQGASSQIVSESVEVPSQYFVYHESEQAKSVSDQLTNIGVDNYVITRDTGTIVSAGVFSRFESAERQQNRLKELGFPAIIDIMYQRETIYHLHGFAEPGSTEYLTSNSDCPTFAHAR